MAVGCRWFGTALEAHADSSSYRFFPREAVHVDNHCYCPKCKRPGLTRPAVHHTAARTAPAPGGSCESCSGWLELLKKRTDRVRAVLVYTRSNAMWCKVDTLEAEICRLRRADKMKNLVMIHSIVNWPNIQVLASLQVFLPLKPGAAMHTFCVQINLLRQVEVSQCAVQMWRCNMCSAALYAARPLREKLAQNERSRAVLQVQLTGNFVLWWWMHMCYECVAGVRQQLSETELEREVLKERLKRERELYCKD